ncbi:hypothetical protein AHAS_Ahas04G0127400 [Arachis hypogaea]
MLFVDMTIGIGLMNRSRDRGRGRVSTSTPSTSGSSPSTPTTPWMSQVIGTQDLPFIMVSNSNYVPPSTVSPPPLRSHSAASREWTFPPLPSIQQPTTSMKATLPTTDTTVLDSSHGSQPDAPTPPSVLWMTI